MPTLTLIRGLPGSGKSTLAKSMTGFHIEADMYFYVCGEYCFDPKQLHDAHEWCQEQAFHKLKQGLDVIVSNTFVRRWEMRPYLEMARRCGAELKVIVAAGDYSNIHDVPQVTLEKMRAQWED